MVSSPFANEVLGYCSALAHLGMCFPLCVAFLDSSLGEAGLDAVWLVLSQLPSRETPSGPKTQVNKLMF